MGSVSILQDSEGEERFTDCAVYLSEPSFFTMTVELTCEVLRRRVGILWRYRGVVL